MAKRQGEGEVPGDSEKALEAPADFGKPKPGDPGAWAASQPEPKAPGQHYQLVTLAKPRRVLVDDVPADIVKFVHDEEGRKQLVFDGIRCQRGVVNFKGVPCYLNEVRA